MISSLGFFILNNFRLSVLIIDCLLNGAWFLANSPLLVNFNFLELIWHKSALPSIHLHEYIFHILFS